MLIKPLTALLTEALNATTVARYPSLKMYCQVNEATGATTITELVSGGTIAATVAAGSVAHAKDILAVTGTVPSFTLPQTTTNPAIYFAIGDFGTAGLAFGDILGADYIAMTATAVISDGGVTYTPATGFTSTAGNKIRAYVITPGTPLVAQVIEYDGTTYTAGSKVAMTAGMTSMTPSNVFSAGANAVQNFGFGILQFTTIPSDAFIRHMLTWMYHNVVTDANKTLCPTLYGVS